MNKESLNYSEEGILEAARQVFMEKGMAGARMQEIADRAGINKAMLHYYFRSKEKLFDRVFTEAFREFWPKVEDALVLDSPREAIGTIVEAYLNVFSGKPYLPNFILSELHRSPGRFEALLKDSGVNPLKVVLYLTQLMDEGVIVRVDPATILVNILSLCVFPFAARPLLLKMVFREEQAWQSFIGQRKQSVMALIEQCYFTKSNIK